MRQWCWGVLCVAGVGLLLAVASVGGAEAPSRKGNTKSVHKDYGIGKRELWTTSKVQGAPDPPSPYRTEVAFTKLKFDSPLGMTRVPGFPRLAITERTGKVFTFSEETSTSEKKLLIDLKREMRGLAFHPQYQKNGLVYVSSVVPSGKSGGRAMQVSRFRARDPRLLSLDLKSEKKLLGWVADGHTGGCLRFGPDGYLYISVGDSSGIADGLKTGQDISDFAGSILRVDVDKTSPGLAYAIPRDNPFINTPNAKPEIYSYGHRQVWKFSFDSATDKLWAGEIGQDLWEMIYIIQKGGNYGWSVMEGSHPFRPERKKGPTPIIKPIVEHNHDHFRSITGGYIYHGSRLVELEGEYIYGDYDTGRIWAFRHQGGKVLHHRELVDTQFRVIAFGQDSSGEVYVLDFVGGRIHRLVPAPPPTKDAPEFPRKLSETGLFASTKDHIPAKGIMPYSVNAKLYSDNADKDRFIALPGNSQIEFDAVTYPQPSPGSPPGWRFPDGTVIVKTFSLEMESGNPQSSKRLETRILHHIRMPGNDDEYGAQVWKGYTYVWNDAQTDAELLDANGLDRTYSIRDADAPGGMRKQTWRFPSRAECTLCHTMSAKYVLGVSTLQMNRDHDYDGVVANQLSTLEHLGMFSKPLPKTPEALPKLDDYHNGEIDLNTRARSYLHANCSHCHRKWGGGNADFLLMATLPLEETGMIGTPGGQGKFDLDDPRILVPGHPERSLIHFRMSKLGLGRMPHVGSNLVDESAVKLIREWIQQLPKQSK